MGIRVFDRQLSAESKASASGEILECRLGMSAEAHYVSRNRNRLDLLGTI
jgi:hypothetical protein